MEVTKLDIKKEVLFILKPNALGEIFYRNEVCPNECNFDSFVQATYNAEQYVYRILWNPITKTEKRILIKEDVWNELKELLDVTQNELENQLSQKRYEGFRDGESYGHSSCTIDIKNLPWWKRLFNIF